MMPEPQETTYEDLLPPPAPEWNPTPKQVAVMRILRERPMLTDWVLRKLTDLVMRIEQATLREMYSAEELEQLKKELGVHSD